MNRGPVRVVERLGLALTWGALELGCYPMGRQLCTESPSVRAERIYEQTCNGVKTTWRHAGCSGDDGWDTEAQAACRAACGGGTASCTLVKTASLGGTCFATTCGSR